MRGRTSLVETIGSFDKNTSRVIIDNQILLFIYDMGGGTDTFVKQEYNWVRIVHFLSLRSH